MECYPLKFEGIYKERIWGGRKLQDAFGKPLPDGVKIGESWELVDLPQDKSVIANGELAGTTLIDVIRKFPKEMTGDPNFTGAFPLLIKLLDCQDVLSVQVHPDEQTCKRMGKGEPKTECWYIIDAAPDACIYKGLKEGVTREQFAEAIAAGTVADLLVQVNVEPGECHYLPSGTAHAIGAGLLIAEIQMPSDTTYRVFDWNRVDDQGNPRQLHIEEALESIHFDPSGDDLSVRTLGRLVDCPYFKVDKGHQAAECELLLADDKITTLVFTSGGGEIIAKNDQKTDFKAGDTIVIPAAFEGAACFKQETEYLKVTL